MSDDLRTRIAAVLWSYFDQTRRDGYIVDGVDGDELADAVIREIGLKRTDGPLKGTPVHRYVTD